MPERLRAIREHTYRFEVGGQPVNSLKEFDDYESTVDVVLKKNMRGSVSISDALMKEIAAAEFAAAGEEESKIVKLDNPEKFEI